jgi:hypothetical protein
MVTTTFYLFVGWIFLIIWYITEVNKQSIFVSFFIGCEKLHTLFHGLNPICSITLTHTPSNELFATRSLSPLPLARYSYIERCFLLTDHMIRKKSLDDYFVLLHHKSYKIFYLKKRQIISVRSTTKNIYIYTKKKDSFSHEHF